MSDLPAAFKLLDGFSTLTPEEQQRRIAVVQGFIAAVENKSSDATEVIWEKDQLRKVRAHLLTLSGQLDEGIQEMASIVDGYEETIATLHESAAFELSEAANACFKAGRISEGNQFALSALAHAGQAKRVDSILLEALRRVQEYQKQTGKRAGP